MNTHDKIELPPLPKPAILGTSHSGNLFRGYIAMHMQNYALSAIEADRQRRGEPVASIYITESGEREIDDWRVPLPVGSTELFAAPQPAEPASVPVDKAGAVGNAFALIRRLASGERNAGEDVESELRNTIREIAAMPAEPVKVLSDADLLELWYSLPNPGRSEDEAIEYGRTLLERYGK